MNWLTTIVRETWGLFVDDGMLAIVSLAWIFAFAYAIRAFHIGTGDGGLPALVFVSGLLIIFATSVVRGARKARSSQHNS